MSADVKENAAANEQYKVYPNPSQDHITIASPSIGLKTISIADVTGKTVLTTREINQDVLLNTLELTPGIYYIIVVNEITGTRSNIKFVKE